MDHEYTRLQFCCKDLRLGSVAQTSPGSISKAALDRSDPRAVEAVDMFLSILGSEAGFMGLRLLATGGVYICGGICPKVRHYGQGHRFLPLMSKGGGGLLALE